MTPASGGAAFAAASALRVVGSGKGGGRLFSYRRRVLVEARCRAIELRGGRVHAHERPGLEHGSEFGIVDGRHAVVLHQLRVVQELGAVAKQVGPDVGIRVEDLQPLVVSLAAHARERPLPERDPHRGIVGVRRIPILRLVQHDVELGDAEVRLPQPFARLRELHPPPVSRQSDQQTKEQRVVRDEPLLVDRRRGSAARPGIGR